jgi:catechol 2,3-dioxygenase-like lactoylglutathione lyase family enzyme
LLAAIDEYVRRVPSPWHGVACSRAKPAGDPRETRRLTLSASAPRSNHHVIAAKSSVLADPLCGHLEVMMKINLTSVVVDDQAKALAFYTDVLGFVKKNDMPAGEARWLTVVSPEGPAEIELLLEPMGFPPAKVYQKALFEAGIPATSFAVDDCEKEYERLTNLGVVFRQKPTKMGPVMWAMFDDTCGNLIGISALITSA